MLVAQKAPAPVQNQATKPVQQLGQRVSNVGRKAPNQSVLTAGGPGMQTIGGPGQVLPRPAPQMQQQIAPMQQQQKAARVKVATSTVPGQQAPPQTHALPGGGQITSVPPMTPPQVNRAVTTTPLPQQKSVLQRPMPQQQPYDPSGGRGIVAPGMDMNVLRAQQAAAGFQAPTDPNAGLQQNQQLTPEAQQFQQMKQQNEQAGNWNNLTQMVSMGGSLGAMFKDQQGQWRSTADQFQQAQQQPQNVPQAEIDAFNQQPVGAPQQAALGQAIQGAAGGLQQMFQQQQQQAQPQRSRGFIGGMAQRQLQRAQQMRQQQAQQQALGQAIAPQGGIY